MSNLSYKALEVINHLAPSYNLDFLKNHHDKNLHLHGAGKSAERMGRDLKNYGLNFKSEFIIGYHSGHPIPNETSVKLAQKMLGLAKKMTKKDLVIFCLSGGASSLMELPLERIELEELQRIYGDLLLSGKDIHTINAERKKLSQVKGGKLGDAYLPAHVHCFIESDVEGDLVEDIGSSPIIGGENSHSFEIVANKDHLLKTVKKLYPDFHSEEINLDIEENIEKHLELIKDHQNIISAGEASVRVLKDGKGGRNTHWVALMGLELMKRGLQFEILSMGTDGRDGDTDAAGAWLDGSIAQEELQKAIDEFNTYTLFEKHDRLIKIDETGYNLNDLRLIEVK